MNYRVLRNRDINLETSTSFFHNISIYEATTEQEKKRKHIDEDEIEFEVVPDELMSKVLETSEIDDVVESEDDIEHDLLDETLTADEIVIMQSQIEMLVRSDFDKYGFDSPAWTTPMLTFPSKNKYEITILQFLSSLERGLNLHDQALAEAFETYLYEDKAKGLRAPTVYRSMFSHVQKFFMLTKKGNLKTMIPGIYHGLKDFENHYKPRHSMAFSEINLRNFYQKRLNDPDYILHAAYTAVQTSNASRCNEGGTSQVFGNVICYIYKLFLN